MIENFISIKTRDGLIDTFEVKPDEGGPFPGIIIYMDAPAIREELRDMARRLASMGYYVLLPNLFYRVGKEGSYPFTFAKIREDKSHFSAMIKTMDDTTNELVVSDTKYILDFLDNNNELKHNGYGAVGYCMSGQYIVSITSTYAKKFAAAASFYGVKILTDKEDSPHLQADKIKADLYLAFAEKDNWVDDKALNNIKEHFKNNTTNFRMEVYEGTEHGFAFPDRHTYNKNAAEKHWSRIHNLFQKSLKNK
jgi:carboxymethylenebutenolidase